MLLDEPQKVQRVKARALLSIKYMLGIITKASNQSPMCEGCVHKNGEGRVEMDSQSAESYGK